jgi:hypothetical protein
VDPVSGAPRYGEGMKGKIQDTHTRVSETQRLYQESMPGFIAAYGRVQEANLNKKKKEEDALEAARQAKTVVDREKSASASAEALRASMAQQAQELDDASVFLANQKLHEEAERARELKRRRNAFKLSLHELLPRLLYEQCLLWTHMSLDVVFDMIMGKGSIERRQGIDVLRFVSTIMERIIAKPDQIALRKLRMNHTTIWEQVTRHSNSLFLLIYCGFSMSLEPIKLDSVDYDDEVINYWYAIMDSSGNQDIYSLFDICQLSNRQIIDLCTSSGYQPIMEMREPDPNSANGMTLWISWFDGIKAKKEEIDAFIRVG